MFCFWWQCYFTFPLAFVYNRFAFIVSLKRNSEKTKAGILYMFFSASSSLSFFHMAFLSIPRLIYFMLLQSIKTMFLLWLHDKKKMLKIVFKLSKYNKFKKILIRVISPCSGFLC